MSNFLLPDRTLKPWAAALVLAMVVALSLLWTQRGLHVSGAFSLLCPTPSGAHGELDAGACSILDMASKDWIGWMALGVFAGAVLTSFWRHRSVRLGVERGAAVTVPRRLALAAGGGLIVGIGAAMAGGCTSSIGLTGASLLSVGAFAFLGVFFLGGFVARIGFGRFWRD
jgi:hypothetical protein